MVGTGSSASRRSLIAALALAVACTAATLQAASAHTNSRDKPIVFLHGYNGGHCTNDWRELLMDMRAAGFSGHFYVVKYLSGDSNCDLSGIPDASNASLFEYGSHGSVYGHPGTEHDHDTDIRHLSWHLSNFLRDHIPDDPPIDVVGHSMGGLIIRFAIAKQGLGDWPNLDIEDVVTLGAPHNGVNFSKWIGTLQGEQMEPESFFIGWLRDRAMNPQGVEGTDWSVLGSKADLVVGQNTATYMSVGNRVRFGLLPLPIGHGDYMHVGGSRDSSVWTGDRYQTLYTYGPKPMTRAALQYDGW